MIPTDPAPTSRVLVTGASGFIGSALVRRLVADGHEVHDAPDLALQRQRARRRAAGLRDLLARDHDPATGRAHALTWDWAGVGPAHDDVRAAAPRAGARVGRAAR